MSVEKNREEAIRWLQTARQDLETARILLENKRYLHCCFHAHQSGEKILKAIWYYKDGDPWGHSVHKLIQELKEFDTELFDSLQDLSEDGAKLDRFYIPTRYPNGLPELTPEQAFFEEDARWAIQIAELFLDRAGKLIED